MIVTHVEITARREFKHPLEADTIVMPEVKVIAALHKNDKVREIAAALQDQAEELVQRQEYQILRSIHIAEGVMANDYDGAEYDLMGGSLAMAVLKTKQCRAALETNDPRGSRS